MVPSIGDSGASRYYVVQMGSDDVPKDERLTAIQSTAQRGYLRRAMRGYIEWLMPQLDELGEALREQFIALRSRAQREVKGSHARSPAMVAHLMIGYELMLRYFSEVLSLGDEWAAQEREKCWRALCAGVNRQAEERAEEIPSRVYLDTMSELLLNGGAYVKNLEQTDALGVGRVMCGYRDSMYYYLLPDVSYALVCEQVRKKGTEFPLTKHALFRQLKEDGLIHPDDGSGRSTRVKRLEGKNLRMLWVPVRFMDGGEPPPELGEQTTFMPVEGEENPF